MSAYYGNCPAGSLPYTIRAGDTLYRIAAFYNTTVERLLEVNPQIDENNLRIGSVLCVPLPLQYYPACSTTNYYVVQNGDSISSISAQFGVTEQQLLYSNMGIDESNLYPGMILCIPIAPVNLRVKISDNTLSAEFLDGTVKSFPCKCIVKDTSTTVIQKQLNSSFHGRKRLNTTYYDIGISNKAASVSPRDAILSDDDMDEIFNIIPIGTEVSFT